MSVREKLGVLVEVTQGRTKDKQTFCNRIETNNILDKYLPSVRNYLTLSDVVYTYDALGKLEVTLDIRRRKINIGKTFQGSTNTVLIYYDNNFPPLR